MTTILLDSDIIVDALHGHTSFDDNNYYAISVISYSEILYGFKKDPSTTTQQELFEELIINEIIHVIDITKETTEIFCNLKVELEKKGTRLEDFDLFIAATALQLNIPLQTRNTKHFSRIPNLQLI